MNEDMRNSEDRARLHITTVIFPVMIRLRRKIDRIKAAARIDEESLIVEMRESRKEVSDVRI
jgi:hypothetical protein